MAATCIGFNPFLFALLAQVSDHEIIRQIVIYLKNDV